MKKVIFSIENARLYFSGQINPVVQFGANVDFSDNNVLIPDGSARSHDKMQFNGCICKLLHRQQKCKHVFWCSVYKS